MFLGNVVLSLSILWYNESIMEEKELKTSPKQRFFICLIAFLMLGSMIASYVAIILNGGKSSSGSSQNTISEEKTLEYEEAYQKKLAEFREATKSDYERLLRYKGEVSAYNETAANSNKVQSRDIKVGSGRTLEENDSNYFAYYIGYCADETVFDSSFDDFENPTGFSSFGMLDLTKASLIEGWYSGMAGAKIGGVREITIAGELAYGDSREICGGLDKPLRFIVLTRDVDEKLATLASETQLAEEKYQYASVYGIDYEEMMNSQK